jgi:hypothetical protein
MAVPAVAAAAAKGGAGAAAGSAGAAGGSSAGVGGSIAKAAGSISPALSGPFSAISSAVGNRRNRKEAARQFNLEFGMTQDKWNMEKMLIMQQLQMTDEKQNWARGFRNAALGLK